MNTWENKFAQL